MPKLVRTTDEGYTSSVSIGYQDSDGAPNLYMEFSIADGAGKNVKCRDWDLAMLGEYNRVTEAFSRAGFNQARYETVDMGFALGEPVELSQGLEHAAHKTKPELENAGQQVLESVGYEIPMHSIIIKPAKSHAAGIKPKEVKPVNLKAMRNEIEQLVTGKMGNTPEAMKLARDIIGAVRKHLGTDTELPPPA